MAKEATQQTKQLAAAMPLDDFLAFCKAHEAHRAERIEQGDIPPSRSAFLRHIISDYIRQNPGVQR